MDQKQFDAGLSDAEMRLRRLKMLYDQWFMGFERSEPATLRKELEDLLARLRREQVTNTAQRFRLQQLVQRHTAFATYWRRIGRQIEEGTYQRDLLRAKRRGKAAQRENNDPELELSYDVDVDLELESVMEEANRVVEAALDPQPSAADVLSSTGVRETSNRSRAEPGRAGGAPEAVGGGAAPEAGAWRELGLRAGAEVGRAPAGQAERAATDSARPAAVSGESATNAVPRAAGGRSDAAARAPGAGGRDGPTLAAKGGGVVNASDGRGVAGPAAVSGAARAHGPRAESNANANGPGAQVPAPPRSPSPSALDASAGAHPPPAPRFPSVSGVKAPPTAANAAAGSPRFPSVSGVKAPTAANPLAGGPRFPSVSGVKAPTGAGANPPGVSPNAVAAPQPSGSPPAEAGKGVGMAPRFPSMSGANAPVGASAGPRFPSLGGVPAPPNPTPAARPAAASGASANHDQSARAGRSISPFALPPPTAGPRPALSKPPPPPAALTAKLPTNAVEPRQRPRPVANDNATTVQAKSPAAKGGNGFSSDDVQRVYDRYLNARKHNAERTDNVKIANIEKTIRGMLPQLEQKHAGKKIDFEVVVRDGKVALKPVAR
jgi:hypothetical protein